MSERRTTMHGGGLPQVNVGNVGVTVLRHDRELRGSCVRAQGATVLGRGQARQRPKAEQLMTRQRRRRPLEETAESPESNRQPNARLPDVMFRWS